MKNIEHKITVMEKDIECLKEENANGPHSSLIDILGLTEVLKKEQNITKKRLRKLENHNKVNTKNVNETLLIVKDNQKINMKMITEFAKAQENNFKIDQAMPMIKNHEEFKDKMIKVVWVIGTIATVSPIVMTIVLNYHDKIDPRWFKIIDML